MNLLELLNKKVNTITFNNNLYYNLLSLHDIIDSLGDKKIIADEHILIPYYIFNNKIYEIYDYELNIVMNGMDVNKFILNKTGSRTIKDVDNDIIQKLSLCYINHNFQYIDNVMLLKYIKYILNCEELRHRIYNIFNEFESKNLYFEIY